MFIYRHKAGNKVRVTEQAIKKVKEVSISGYTAQQNLYTSEIRKELLRYAKEWNDSNEVACLVDLNRLARSDFIIGDSNSVNIDADAIAYHMLMSGERNSLELIHNHPGLSYFSIYDVIVFLKNVALKSITVVTNQGNTYSLTKTNRYVHREAIKLLFELSNTYEGEELVAKFVKKAYALGIERN